MPPSHNAAAIIWTISLTRWSAPTVPSVAPACPVQTSDASAMQATVLHKAFRGAEFLYTLQLPQGGQVYSLVPSHHNHAIGEKIGIRLELDHLVAYPRDPAAAQIRG